jgi:4-oxalomesaconate tautomerase
MDSIDRRLTGIPCLFMRGGTSRGPYFNANDLPIDPAERDKTLLQVMGSPDIRQIDGLGGADPLTSKVAIVSKSDQAGIDVNYLFAQVGIENGVVDTNPSCGNMLAGIGPYAIETGIVPAADGETKVSIYNVNTQSMIEAVIQTPGGKVNYQGNAKIDGVPGTSAPIFLNFTDVCGSKTSGMLPTGKPIEKINGIDASCVDVAMPMVLFRAADLGISGYEDRDEIANNSQLFREMEPLRLEAGLRMGLGDVKESVIPKIGLLAEPREGGDICSRYFMPWKLHAAHAVTGGICVASAASVPGTVAFELSKKSGANPRDFKIEHPSGQIDVRLEMAGEGDTLTVAKAGLLRTARLIMRGEVFV